MSMYPSEPGPTQGYYYQPPPTNALGIAGFVVSLSGMIVCLGLISPIGLVLSLIALAKSPRGYAVAGSIIGLLGSALGTLTVLVLTNNINLNLFGSPFYSHTYNQIEAASYDIDNHFLSNQDTLPDEATGDAIIAGYYDEWNNSLKYTPATNSAADYTITSLGPDGVLNTTDDIVQYYTAQTQTEVAMDNATYEIDDYYSNNSVMPNFSTGNTLISQHRDTWGKSIQYEQVTGSSMDYALTSAGPDGQFQTSDDISARFTAYNYYSGNTPPSAPIETEMRDVDAAFDAAAKKIIASFPADAALPTTALIKEQAGELLDAWSVPMRYKPTKNPPYYHLVSAGPDRQWDTADDITRSFFFAPTGGTDGPE
ncbi:MAG: DUF4190 domain-containing protein [Planctomycetota bacterium]